MSDYDHREVFKRVVVVEWSESIKFLGTWLILKELVVEGEKNQAINWISDLKVGIDSFFAPPHCW